MRQKGTVLLLTTLLIGQLCGCLFKDPIKLQKELNENAEQIANTHGFQKQLIRTNPFILTSYQKFQTPSEPLIVYIEGDGRSVTATQQISSNPTPLDPMALKLAVLHTNAANIAYLARPCQYTPFYLDNACHPRVWSHARFSEQVVQSMDKAIEKLKEKAGAKEVHLIGFSGGAAIAILVAARRSDVVSLRTVAGDLDHTLLTQYHNTPPLQDSLNPRAAISNILILPQYHFAGAEDVIVPPFVSEIFVNEIRKLGSSCAKRRVLEDVTHHKNWEKHWQSLLSLPLDCIPAF